ncbi:hypothetical protein BH11PSE2_BH11PSE2_22300 [soil metagenome]
MTGKGLGLAVLALLAVAGPSLAAKPAPVTTAYHAEGRLRVFREPWRALVIERQDSAFRFEFDDKAAPGLRWAIVGDARTDRGEMVAVKWVGARPERRAVSLRKAMAEAGIDPFGFLPDWPAITTAGPWHRFAGFECTPPYPDLAGCVTRQGAPVYVDDQKSGWRTFELDRVQARRIAAAAFAPK